MPQKMNVGLGYDYDINNYYSSIAKVIGYEGKFINNLDKPIGMKRKLVNSPAVGSSLLWRYHVLQVWRHGILI